VGYENRTQLLDKIYGADYDPKADVEDQRTQQAPQTMDKEDTKSAGAGATKEALVVLREIRERAALIGNGRH
jgi:hypothetical protein